MLLVGIEYCGRGSRSELQDAVLGTLLIGCGVATWTQRLVDRNTRPSRFWQPLNRFLGHLRDSMASVGVDFRQQPSFPNQYPRTWQWLVGGVIALVTATMLLSPWLPRYARAWLVDRFYLGWLVLWLGIWCAALGCLLFQGFVIWGCIHDRLVTSYRGDRPRPLGPEYRLLIVLGVVALVAAVTLPTALAGLLLAGMLVIQCLCGTAFQHDLAIVWREPASQQIYRMDAHCVELMQWLIVWTLMTVLWLVTLGDTAGQVGHSQDVPPLPLLQGFGALQVWISVITGATITRLSLRAAWLATVMNPSRKPTGVHARSADPEEQRRWEIVARRKVTAGLESLFKRAIRSRQRDATGYWLGLQHWYMLGLSDDGSGGSLLDREGTILDQILGWPFHQAIPQFARHHYWQMARALQIDLIFVEKGVPYRRFVRVLRMMFEIFDIYGGRQRAEERYFVGLPGVRVLVLDYEVNDGSTERLTKYVEPSYDQISRARILYVFKDRGAEEVEETVPQDFEGLPILSGT